MLYPSSLLRCQFLRREKRFFVYAVHPVTGAEIVAHTPNTGSMRGVLDDRDDNPPVAAVWLLHHGDDAPRTLKYTLEAVEKTDGTLIGTHTGRTNALAAEALANPALFPQFAGYTIKAEVPFPADKSTRFDFLLTSPTGQICWAEVKHVSLARGTQALFPDSVTTRGAKHLGHLTAVAASAPLPAPAVILNSFQDLAGHPPKALQLFIAAREDVTHFSPAEDIDPTYATALHALHAAGGTIVALGCTFAKHPSTGAPLSLTATHSLKIIL